MKIQWKITLLVFLTLVATTSAVIWKTREGLIKDKLGFLADSSMKQISPLKRLVQERLDSQKALLVKFAGSRTSSGRSRVFGDFDVIALLQPGASVAVSDSSSTLSQWAAAWVEKSSAAKPEIWPQGYDLTLLKSLPYGRVKDGETVWTRLSDRQGSPIYAVMISVEIQTAGAPVTPPSGVALPDSTDYKDAPAGSGKKAIVVGLASSDPMASVTEDYIGSMNTVFLVDDRGYVASHVNKAYLGSLFSEDPIVQEIVKTRKTAASGRYEDLESRSVLGHFERIDRTNLYAVITTPLQAANEVVSQHVQTAVRTAVAVGLLGLILAWLLGRSITQPVEAANQAIEPHVARVLDTSDELGTLTRFIAESSPAVLRAKKTSNTSEPGVTEPSHATLVAAAAPIDRIAAERRAIYESFNDGFSRAMKEPLMAILGHAQLVKSKSSDTEVIAHAESVEREVRRSRALLDRLESWTSKAQSESKGSVVDVRDVIQGTLGDLDTELSADEIKVSLELGAVPRVHGSADLIKSTILHLVENAREAMRARPDKELRVRLDYSNDFVCLVVSDSGVGMSRDVKERAFDPFYKGFESSKRMGLGLSFVQTAMKGLGGTAEIESSPGEGCAVTLKIPVTEAETDLFRQSESASRARLQSAESDFDSDRAEPPAGASVRSNSETVSRLSDKLGDKLGDQSDDDDTESDAFAHVSISPQQTGSDDESFRVRIRRPRVRS